MPKWVNVVRYEDPELGSTWLFTCEKCSGTMKVTANMLIKVTTPMVWTHDCEKKKGGVSLRISAPF